MATTSPDDLWTPDTGDDYALTVDLAAFADTVQEAFTKLGLPAFASNAARDAYYPSPVNGDAGIRTDLGYIEMYDGTTWRPAHWGSSASVRPYAAHQMRRSDGQLLYNDSINTDFRWEGSPSANSLGLTFSSDANGAFFTPPRAGLYEVNANALLSNGSAGAFWAQIQMSGGVALKYAVNEASWGQGFSSTSVTATLQLDVSTKVWFPFLANNAGVLRDEVTVQVYPVY